MTVLPIYVFSGSDPCSEGKIPYKREFCNYIEYGLLDSVRYMQGDDAWYGDSVNQGYLWRAVKDTEDFAKVNELSSGNLYFMDTDNLKILFKLPRLLVTRSRVRDAMKTIWKLKYQEQGGQPGYISENPDGGDTWYPLTALADSELTTAYGNPVVSLLEMIANLLDAALDVLLPNILNLIPWYVWVGGAGLTGLKTKQTLPSKPSLKNIKPQTYLWGLATAFLLYRAYRSHEAKANRIDGIGQRKPRVARRAPQLQIK